MDQLNISEAARRHIEAAYLLLIKDIPESEYGNILRIMFSMGYAVGCDNGSGSKIDLSVASKWCLAVLTETKYQRSEQ